jgi:hypothetical protein
MKTPQELLLAREIPLIVLTEQQYQAPFTVQVTDTAGHAVANQKVTISAVPISYVKGSYRIIDSNGDGTNDSWAIEDPNIPGAESMQCAREDLNQNGILDAGEDINNSGQLEPTNSATVASHPTHTPTISSPGSLLTDINGLGYFSLIYPKSEALWSTVRITASIKATGTESAETFDYYLLVLKSDAESIDIMPPGGVIASNYGTVLDCSDRN